MAENLNEYFSLVFTREAISALLVPETKLEGRESEHLGQLIVTPQIVGKKIRDVKDNKSSGWDGIPKSQVRCQQTSEFNIGDLQTIRKTN